MGMNFRKSVKIAPGVKLNFSKRGAGISVGPKGYKVSVNSKGDVYRSVSIPGTGLYSRKKIDSLQNDKDVPKEKVVETKPVVQPASRKRPSSQIILWVLSAMFAFGSISLFFDGNIPPAIFGLILTILLFIIGKKM